MYDICAWKQLIKILLPVSYYLAFGLLLLVQLEVCSGSGLDSERKLGSEQSKSKAGGDDAVVIRSHKVKAKWKGEKFWTEAAANLTQMERLKTLENSVTTFQSNGTQRSSQSSSPSNQSLMSRNKGPSKKRSTLHSESKRPRTTNNNSSTTSTPSNSTSSTTKPTKPTKTAKPSTKVTAPSTTPPFKTPFTSTKPSSKPKKHNSSSINKPKSTSKPKTPRPSAFSKLTIAPKTELERATIIADLSPFQDYYLEYHSDEEDVTTERGTEPYLNETTTQAPIINGTSTPSRNSSQFSISFYPKTPVNLLYLLQAYASNMQPIKLQSPIAGGPSATVPVPMSIPVKVNPPNSPFLFNFDLDSFFTRMAIAFFYSSIAIAPLIYVMIGGLGSLGGLSIVPFTGKKRRKRRNALSKSSDNGLIKFIEDFEPFEKKFKKNFTNVKI